MIALHLLYQLSYQADSELVACEFDRPIRLTNAVPNSNLLGIKRFVPSISISFKCECFIVMQIQHTKNLNLERFELGTTMS